MPPRHPNDADTEFGDAVNDAETGAVKRGQRIDIQNTWVRSSLVVTIVLFMGGGVWGIAISFSSFKANQQSDHEAGAALRTDFEKRKAHVLSMRELDIWADAMRIRNGDKVFVPKPSDYKIDN